LISILREPEGWEAEKTETKEGKISINTEGHYMRIKKLKISKKKTTILSVKNTKAKLYHRDQTGDRL
jgi:hypothetical protein